MSTWATTRLHAVIYDFGVEREWLARPAGALLWGTDTRELFSTIHTLGALPAGTAVLDVPCGGGSLAGDASPPPRNLKVWVAFQRTVRLSGWIVAECLHVPLRYLLVRCGLHTKIQGTGPGSRAGGA